MVSISLYFLLKEKKLLYFLISIQFSNVLCTRKIKTECNAKFSNSKVIGMIQGCIYKYCEATVERFSFNAGLELREMQSNVLLHP
jgi:hypothetical protein